MILETHIPGYPLNQFVDHFVYHEGYNPANSLYRLLPDGNVEIIIDFLERPQFIYDNESLKEIQACRHVWASGLRSEPITIPSEKDSEMLIISFKKGMAYPFFPLPMNELVNCVVDADLIWGREFADLRETILETKNVAAKFDVAERFLTEKFMSNLVVNPCVEFALHTLIQTPYQISLARLSEKIGYSQKHFISLFTNQVGITPKNFLKILRFQKAVYNIEKVAKVDWSAISNDCGFFDQAHFISDFKLFSGFRPNEYLKQKDDLLNYVPVG